MAAEFTLSLSRREPAVYAARLRVRPDDLQANELTIDGVVKLDAAELAKTWEDRDGRTAAENYGRALADAVFPVGSGPVPGAETIRDAWLRARGEAGNPIRVRLELEEYAVELHRLRWETLRDPQTGSPLLTDQNVWFSRYLHSFDMRRLRPPARTAARVLLAVAAPSDLDGTRIGVRAFGARDQFDAEREVAAIKDALAGWTRDVTVLAGPEKEKRPTLIRIVEHLRTGTGFDVLYLVAHGALHPTGPKLLLVDDDGKGAVTDADRLTDELRRLRFPPRLVVLSSCQSAGDGHPAPAAGPGGELDAALGPALGRIGIPAVVAMLGNVLQTTANIFVRTFFKHLGSGQVDQAAAEARQAVVAARTADSWAPVLYTRLTNGRLWRDTRAGGDRFDQWDGLVQQLKRGRCVPVLGSGFLEPLVGPTQGLAERLPGAQAWFAAIGLADLPQAAQFSAVTQGGEALRTGYLTALADEVREQFGDIAPAAALGEAAPAQAGDDPDDHAQGVRLLLKAAAARLADDHTEAHDVLARLGCPIYLSTNPDDLLAEALARAGRQPAVRVCNWLTPRDNPPGAPPEGEKPTRERPLVYHLFGHLSDPFSVVLSEDDYFRFLIGISKAHFANAFKQINAQLVRSSLLFLGFRLDDWDFRAFLHFFMGQEAAKNRREFDVRDVAVQLDPDDGRNAHPDRVRRYLEQLFRTAQISIYWGSTQDFLAELESRCKPTP